MSCKSTKVIPYGYYCYEGSYKNRQVCPYWSIKKNKPKMENGYCSFLGKGDWQINDEDILTMYKKDKKGKYKEVEKGTAHELGVLTSVIWDQVKMCNTKIHRKKEEK